MRCAGRQNLPSTVNAAATALSRRGTGRRCRLRQCAVARFAAAAERAGTERFSAAGEKYGASHPARSAGAYSVPAARCEFYHGAGGAGGFGPAVRIDEETHGFRWTEDRDLSGFVDGTETRRASSVSRWRLSLTASTPGQLCLYPALGA